MFALFKSTVVLSAVASLAITGIVANPVTNGGCNQGTVSCCNSLQSPTSVQEKAASTGLLGELLGGLLGELDLDGLLDLASQYSGNIGVDCSGAVNCDQQTVCCQDTYNGLINVGCSPITVNV